MNSVCILVQSGNDMTKLPASVTTRLDETINLIEEDARSPQSV